MLTTVYLHFFLPIVFIDVDIDVDIIPVFLLLKYGKNLIIILLDMFKIILVSPGDMVARMRKVLARRWVGVRVWHLLLSSFFSFFIFVFSFLPDLHIRDLKEGVEPTGWTDPRTRTKTKLKIYICILLALHRFTSLFQYLIRHSRWNLALMVNWNSLRRKIS